jgi:hypothetical protein
MKYRMLMAIAAALIGVGPALAQVPCAAEAGPAHPAFWASADILLGRINGPANNVPFVTTAPIGTPRLQAGVRNDPATSVLFGATPNDRNGFNEDARVGFRLGVGAPVCENVAVEAGFMMLEGQTSGILRSSDGSTILARPFTNPIGRVEQSVLVAFPGVATGTIDVNVSSSVFYSGNLDLTETICDQGWVRLQSLLGYRFFRYDTAVRAATTINPLEANFIPGTQIDTRDDFSAQNEFHGCEIGLRASFEYEDFCLSLTGKVAGGNLRREVKISGLQTVSVPGLAPVVSPGGFYALASNSGIHTRNDASVVPEFAALLSWRVSPMLRLRAGYTLTQLVRVADAANQIDTFINPALLPPATRPPVVGDRPRFLMSREDVWVTTLNVGAEFTW